jgi:hypothetical protein
MKILKKLGFAVMLLGLMFILMVGLCTTASAYYNYYGNLIYSVADREVTIIGYDFDINKCADDNIVRYIKTVIENQKTDDSEKFEQFYHEQAVAYQGFVKREDAMRQFLSYHRITFDQYKQDNEGNIYIPQDKKVGHVCIKYDASKSCHSLGPFRVGGDFYFFNTVVNRAMPCEYWLDEDKKTRQYYLKQNDCEDTTGGGTWTLKGDNSHFIWVEDEFEEAKECIDEWELGLLEYNSDNWKYITSDWTKTCTNHRKRNINNEGYKVN